MGFMDNEKFGYAWGKIKEYFAERYATKTEIGDKQNTLTEGNNITIFGDVISSSVPQATETTFGGFKAQARTTETNEVKIDTATGKLYALAPDLANIPTATTSVKGGVKVGNGLTMTDETMSVDTTVIATVAQVNALDIPTAEEIQAIIDDVEANTTALTSKADLVGGKVPASQLPDGLDEIIEVDTYADLPTTGQSSIIYIVLTGDEANRAYRWSGTVYVPMFEAGSGGLVLGETETTAYRGDRGAIAYAHSQITLGNPHGTTKTDIGLGNVDNTSDADKPVSTAVTTMFGNYWSKTELQPMTEAEIDTIIV